MHNNSLNVWASQSREKQELQVKHGSSLAVAKRPEGKSEVKSKLYTVQKTGRFQNKMSQGD